MTQVPASSHGGGPAAGTYAPTANATGVTLDTTTYADPIAGGGAKLATLVFPGDQGALAIAISGDAFPRWLFAASSSDGLYIGDGAHDSYSLGPSIGTIAGETQLQLYAPTGGLVSVQAGPLVVATAPSSSDGVPRLREVSPRFTITSGALPTVALVSGAGAQISTTRDADTHTPVTFNPGVATTATCTVALSPDNTTYSTLAVVTKPVGTVFDGEIDDIVVRVPAGWYLKLTVVNATIGTTTYY